MPQNVSYGGSKKDSESMAAAKGHNGKSFASELFSQVEDFFYEFGLMSKPGRDDSGNYSEEHRIDQAEHPDSGSHGEADRAGKRSAGKKA